jgi:phage repressor protein C with HTH and peptisase S24 domain
VTDDKPATAGIMITDGLSMKETIDHADPVLVDMSEREARDDIFIMGRGGGVIIKRLQ